MSVGTCILPSSLLSSFGSSLVRFLLFFGFISSSSSTAQRKACQGIILKTQQQQNETEVKWEISLGFVHFSGLNSAQIAQGFESPSSFGYSGSSMSPYVNTLYEWPRRVCFPLVCSAPPISRDAFPHRFGTDVACFITCRNRSCLLFEDSDGAATHFFVYHPYQPIADLFIHL